MSDQAKELRKLVAASRMAGRSGRRRPKRLVVTGGKGGVGVTTIAVNLAVTLASQGRRTLLIDAEPNRHDAMRICGLDDASRPRTAMAARRPAEESLLPGPGGLFVLPDMPHGVDLSRDSAGRFDDDDSLDLASLDALQEWKDRLDVVVFDAGNGSGARLGNLWRSADLVLLLTTPDTPALMDAYTAAKLLAPAATDVPIYSLVNLAPDAATADDVHGRLSHACQRFLGITLGAGGSVPRDARIAALGNEGEPFVLADPANPAIAPLRALARLVAAAAQIESRTAVGDDSCRPVAAA